MILFHCHQPIDIFSENIQQILQQGNQLLLREQAVLSAMQLNSENWQSYHQNLLVLKNDAQGLGISQLLDPQIKQINDDEFVEQVAHASKTVSWK